MLVPFSLSIVLSSVVSDCVILTRWLKKVLKKVMNDMSNFLHWRELSISPAYGTMDEKDGEVHGG